MQCGYSGLHVVYALEYNETSFLGLSRYRKTEPLTKVFYLDRPRTDVVVHHFRLNLGGQLKPDKPLRDRVAVLLESILTNDPLLPALNVSTFIDFLDNEMRLQPREITNACARLDVRPRALPGCIWQSHLPTPGCIVSSDFVLRYPALRRL
jgi:hypothetical protein